MYFIALPLVLLLPVGASGTALRTGSFIISVVHHFDRSSYSRRARRKSTAEANFFCSNLQGTRGSQTQRKSYQAQAAEQTETLDDEWHSDFLHSRPSHRANWGIITTQCQQNPWQAERSWPTANMPKELIGSLTIFAGIWIFRAGSGETLNSLRNRLSFGRTLNWNYACRLGKRQR
jgi:hypothetical protein